jgi:hypothetical protein
LAAQNDMEPASRTPEGEPNRCPVCGKRVRIEPSRPSGDVPCPHCGHLLWFQRCQKSPGSLNPLADRSISAKGSSRRSDYGLDEFRRMLEETRKLAPLSTIVGSVPGLGSVKEVLRDADAEKEMRRLAAIIDSMTPNERRQPDLIERKRGKRIAVGAGVDLGDVTKLIKEFGAMQNVMRRLRRK